MEIHEQGLSVLSANSFCETLRVLALLSDNFMEFFMS